MQLSSGTQIPDGLLAAMTLLNEKPRLGVPSKNPAPNQGIDERNSTSAIGMRLSERLNSVGQSRRARYYASNMGRFMSPDWDSKPQAVPYANLAEPQSLNLYSYVLNNPLSKADPNGHDWFNVDNKWQWQKGHTYHDADGNATKAKGYEGLLVATATGTNKQGATTYSLTLYDQNKVVATGTGFSGNNNFAETGAIKNGNYQILGRFDAPPTGPNPASADNNPPPVYGYQKIDPSLNSYANAVYQAYGPMRARLNPLDPSNTDGVYFHGQFGDAFHSEGWTHGCLSYGRDTTMINYMADHFGNGWTGVSVNTPVVKP